MVSGLHLNFEMNRSVNHVLTNGFFFFFAFAVMKSLLRSTHPLRWGGASSSLSQGGGGASTTSQEGATPERREAASHQGVSTHVS